MLADERHWSGDGRVQSRLEDRGLDQRLRRPAPFLPGWHLRTPALRSQNGNAILKYRFTGILKNEKRGESPGRAGFELGCLG